MDRRLWCAALTVLLYLCAAAGERIETSQAVPDLNIKVLESNSQKSVIKIEIGAFSREPVTIDGKSYYQIALTKEGNSAIVGEPSLPRACRSVIIPDNAKVKINVLDSEYRDYPMLIAPSKGNLTRDIDPETVPYTFGPVYSDDSWYPEELAVLREPYILRDLRGIVFEINCFRYNPVSQLLRVYTSITIEIFADGPGETNVLSRTRPFDRVSSEFDLIYQRQFLNYNQQMSLYNPVPETGDMLIISYDAFSAAMQPLVDWKMQKGISTTLVNISTIGNNSTAIRNYIQTYYSINPIAWVLLVGDVAQIATLYSAGGASDPSYAKVAGGDNYPDIFIGRFSAQTAAQVQTQVQRTIEYESSPQVDPWHARATGIASDQGPGHFNEYDYQHMNLIRNSLLGYNYTLVDQIYDPWATASDVTNALNNGRGVVNYCGHGSSTAWGTTGFSISNVNALNNVGKLPFIISVACVNGEFDTGTCFAEAWLRATSGGNPSGAVATYMSSINQYWDPPMDAQDEAVDLLVAESNITFGGICFNGSCRMIDINGADGVDMYDTWHIFGDPSLQLFTASPTSMTVNHSGSIQSTDTEYNVNVPGITGALCAVYYSGILYGSTYTDAGGDAVIPISDILPSGVSLTLTITALNRIPYTGQIVVTEPDGPFVDFDSYTINDLGGNNDSNPNSGESLILGVQLANTGTADANGVSALISTLDAHTSIVDNSELFGTINANGGTGYVDNAYSVDIAPNTPDGHTIVFDLAITSDPDYFWNSGFNITVQSPVLNLEQVFINDVSGNGNGFADPGETIELTVLLSNSGSAAAGQTAATIGTTDGQVTITDPNGYFGDIAPLGGTADNSGDTFAFQISSQHPVNSYIPMTILCQDNLGNSFELQFDVYVGTLEVPTLSQWGIIILTLLLMGLATAALIRSKKTLVERA